MKNKKKKLNKITSPQYIKIKVSILKKKKKIRKNQH